MRAYREVTVRTVTLVVALLQQRSVTARVWNAVIGLVVYVSLYARPALSFLRVVFHEADAYDLGAVFVPSRRARAELATWVAYVPFMFVVARSRASLLRMRLTLRNTRALVRRDQVIVWLQYFLSAT